jgi:hypothetical protein
VIRSIVAVAAAALVVASVSGAAEQPPKPIPTTLPGPQFPNEAAALGGPFSIRELDRRARPLGPAAPQWARRMYRDSIRVLMQLTDPDSGAQLAGAQVGWDRVWPRDAAAGAIALQGAGLHLEASRITGYLEGLELDYAAQFESGGEPIPGRGPAGDAGGWVAAAVRAMGHVAPKDISGGLEELEWEGRQDYGENIEGDLLGNAIAAGVPAGEILGRFMTARGLTRVAGGEALDSAAAWAVIPFGRVDGPGADRAELREAVRHTLLALAADSGRYGITPAEGWRYEDGWTAPTAWTAAALAELGETAAADRMLAALRAAATHAGMLPERVDRETGEPRSATPLAWSHAFAILALRARYSGD